MLESLMSRRGFTAIELLVVLVVIAVLAALAAPSFNDQISRRRLEGVATEMSADLQYARSQAVSEAVGSTVSLVTENAGTQYRVFKTVASTNTTLKTVTLPSGITVTNGVTATYDQLRGMAASAVQFDLSSTKTAAQMRLNVNAMGRASLCSPGGSMKGHTTC